MSLNCTTDLKGLLKYGTEEGPVPNSPEFHESDLLYSFTGLSSFLLKSFESVFSCLGSYVYAFCMYVCLF